jgi:hypothetical protein
MVFEVLEQGRRSKRTKVPKAMVKKRLAKSMLIKLKKVMVH